MQPILSIFLDRTDSCMEHKNRLANNCMSIYTHLMCIPSEPHDLYIYSVAKNLLPKLELAIVFFL